MRPLTVFAIERLGIGKVKALVKLDPEGAIVTVPLVFKLFVKPEVREAKVKAFPINSMFALLDVILVPALDPILTPKFVVIIPEFPPFRIMLPELDKMS